MLPQLVRCGTTVILGHSNAYDPGSALLHLPGTAIVIPRVGLEFPPGRAFLTWERGLGRSFQVCGLCSMRREPHRRRGRSVPHYEGTEAMDWYPPRPRQHYRPLDLGCGDGPPWPAWRSPPCSPAGASRGPPAVRPQRVQGGGPNTAGRRRRWPRHGSSRTTPAPHRRRADGDWWRAFQDPLLDSLVVRAYRQNPDLRSVGTRVLQAHSRRSRWATSSRRASG